MKTFAKFAWLILVLLFVQAAKAQLDPTFGTNGVTVTNVAGSDRAIEVFLLPSGKILVLNSSTTANPTTFQLLRYNADGTLDATYGNGGIAALNFPSLQYAQFTKAVRQIDGKIVLTGRCDTDSLIVRVNEDATLDTSFAGIGYTRPNFNPNGYEEQINGLVVQPDGKILVASYFNSFGNILYFVRYLPNGTLDATFGNGGIISHTISLPQGSSLIVEDIYLQSNGKILIKGNQLRRFNADGSADNTFPAVSLYNSWEPMRTQMVVQPDDKFLIATRVYKTATLERAEYDVRVTRYNQNGNVDTGFGVGGQVDIDVSNVFRDEPIALAVQPDNQILVGITTFVPPNRSRIRNYMLALARLSPSGALNGKFLLTRGSGNYNGVIKIQPDGKILAVHEGNGDLLLTRSVGVPLVNYSFHGVPFDYNLDGITEPSIFRPDSAKWYFYPDAGTGLFFGAPGDILAPSDYIGSFAVDLAVFRPSNGTWYIGKNSLTPAQNFIAVQWGQAGDVPVPADYDGDSKSDIAVFRPSNGGWYIRNGADNSITAYLFGQNGDKPVAGDYDGDGRADIGVYRPSNGTWYIQRSSGGFVGIAFGASDDVPVPEDYDGDGKIDIAVFRPSTGVWYLIKSSDGTFSGTVWGFSTDTLVPADYDGDLKTDIAVFRPSDNRWYVLRSSDGAMQIYYWGLGTDVPLPKKLIN